MAAFGAWPSPITPLRALHCRRYDVVADGDDVLWLELHPVYGGARLHRWNRALGARDVLPAELEPEARMYGYGGGAFAARNGLLAVVDRESRGLVLVAGASAPVRLAATERCGYAQPDVDASRGRLVALEEQTGTPTADPVHRIVSVPLDPQESVTVLTEGRDFYAAPRLSPDGQRLAWLAWDQPNHPWDGCELWVADVRADGQLAAPTLVAGGTDESIFQPEWSPDGHLFFVSDRGGWWNLHRLGPTGAEIVLEREAEFGVAQWRLSDRTYAFESARRLVCAWTRDGAWALGTLDLDTGGLTTIDTSFTFFAGLAAAPGRAIVAGETGARSSVVVAVRLDTGAIERLSGPPEVLDEAYVSRPAHRSFRGRQGAVSHGLVYPPHGPSASTDPGRDRPPLLIDLHGGPASHVTDRFRPDLQLFTSRGFTVVAVNFRGSTGYGRAYRRAQIGGFGVVDVEDVVTQVDALVCEHAADPARVVVRGGSNGGFLALACLAGSDRFRAGAATYPWTDLVLAAHDLHVFESRSLQVLAGGPEELAARSPLLAAGRIAVPVLLLHGSDDIVIPPVHSHRMARALARVGVPSALVEFPGEGHGFAHAPAVERSLRLELAFFELVLGLPLSDTLPPELGELENVRCRF